MSQPKGFWKLLLMAEILHHTGMYEILKNNGINYQPELVSRISEPSTVCRHVARIDFIQQNGLQLEWILETHAHADHLSAAPYIQEKLGGKIAIGENIRLVQDVFAGVFNFGPDFQRDGSQFDKLFADGESFRIGELTASVMYTPGHTPACVCYLAIRLDHL